MGESQLHEPDKRPLLDVRGVSKHFAVSAGWLSRLIGGPQSLRAVDDVSFAIEAGGTLGLVGESGSGKSTLARVLVGLDRPTAGQVLFDGSDINAIQDASTRAGLRRNWQMVFQDPYASLNPRWRVSEIVGEPIRAFGLAESRAARNAIVAQLLQQVGLSARDATRYPHEFSGGQRQRIAIARALASKPRFIVCDEPTSALDVSVQAQILNLMKDIQRDAGVAYLFISHDLAVVRFMADVIGVMYLGRLCEMAQTNELVANPMHPYTRLLIDVMPDLEASSHTRESAIGERPDPMSPPSGCAFHPRCAHANERCRRERPQMLSAGRRMVACHAVNEGRL